MCSIQCNLIINKIIKAPRPLLSCIELSDHMEQTIPQELNIMSFHPIDFGSPALIKVWRNMHYIILGCPYDQINEERAGSLGAILPYDHGWQNTKTKFDVLP